jgi:hypothetical protein
MRSIKIPSIKFSTWYAWRLRKELPRKDFPGIYMIAITKKNLDGKKADYSDVVYIGMTNSKGGLKSRLNQFYSAIRGNYGHSGGNTIYRELGHYEDWTKKLFVCVMPIECNVISPEVNDLLKMGWITYLEYEAFSIFKKKKPRIGKPIYNTR